MRRNAPERRSKPTYLIATCALLATLATVAGLPQGDDDRVSATPEQPAAVIVGDSLTGGNKSYIAPVLRDAGLDVRIEGLSARRIAVSFDSDGRRDSGVERVRALRAAGVAPALWVVELGSNDLGAIANCACADPVAFAGTIIDQLLTVIGPNVPIAWVTVLDWNRPAETRWFNAAIGARAARDPYISLISWPDLARSRPDWFIDHVHPNSTGVKVFTQMYVDELRALLAHPLGPRPPGPGPAPAVRLGPR